MANVTIVYKNGSCNAVAFLSGTICVLEWHEPVMGLGIFILSLVSYFGSSILVFLCTRTLTMHTPVTTCLWLYGTRRVHHLGLTNQLEYYPSAARHWVTMYGSATAKPISLFIMF